MLPSANQAGCSTSNGTCPTCPNAPKTPKEWYYNLPPATQTILKLIVGVSAVVTLLTYLFPSVFPPPPGSAEGIAGALQMTFDKELGKVVYASGGDGSDGGMVGMLKGFFSSTFTTALTMLCFIPRQLFDYTPMISISFLMDVYLLVSFLAKLEVDVFGGLVLDFFDFPGQHLFTTTQLATMRDGELRRQNVFVRSLRTVWCYVMLSGALFLGFWVICAPFNTFFVLTGLSTMSPSAGGVSSVVSWEYLTFLTEMAKPTRVMSSAIGAVWCFLAPRDTRLKIPFASMFVGSGNGNTNNRTGTSQEGSSATNGSQNGAPPAPQASEARTNATYSAFLRSKDTIAANGVKARHYPYVMATIHWVMSGGSMLALARELMAVRGVAFLYAYYLSDRVARDTNMLPRVWEERAVKALNAVYVFVNVTVGGAVFGMEEVGGGGASRAATKTSATSTATPTPSSNKFGSFEADDDTPITKSTTKGATTSSSPQTDTESGTKDTKDSGKGTATNKRRYAPRRLIIPLSVQLYIKHTFVTELIPRHSFDVPRVACRWLKRRLTTDAIDALKAKKALTPWAH